MPCSRPQSGRSDINRLENIFDVLIHLCPLRVRPNKGNDVSWLCCDSEPAVKGATETGRPFLRRWSRQDASNCLRYTTWHRCKVAHFKYHDGESIERPRTIHTETLNHLLKTAQAIRQGRARPEQGEHRIFTANHLLGVYFCVSHLSFLVPRRTLNSCHNKAWVMRGRVGWNRAGSIRAEEINEMFWARRYEGQMVT